MKTDKLIAELKARCLNLPHTGTGMNGRILARDLEHVLGSYYVEGKYPSTKDQQHLKMRRDCIPMKAYRYDKLSTEYKENLWLSDSWVAEEKFNGWRMMITFIPGSGLRFWGGNISDVDFLPVDYTDHVVIDGKHPQDVEFHYILSQPALFDSEVVCNDEVEMLDGMWSTNTLDAVKAILGCDTDRAQELQKYADLEFHLFDVITYNDTGSVKQHDLMFRRIILETVITQLKPFKHFYLVKQETENKKDFLRDVWRQGGEGVILKNLLSKYEPASRKKDIAVKVKRKVSGEIGEDIDAFIIGYTNTKEWEKRHLIGGIELGVHTEEGDIHHIATVTNMPDSIRKMLSVTGLNGRPALNDNYMYKVLTIDGQELSGRNQKLMHAVVDWDRGFRYTKSASECLFKLKTIKQEMF